MFFRTDLALELREQIGNNIEGVQYSNEQIGNTKINRMQIINNSASHKIGKPIGKYVTIEVPALTDHFDATDERISILSDEIKKFIPAEGLVLVAGLGNLNITPDALGPKCIHNVLATRHISGEIAKSTGLEKLRSVAAVAPGVLGQTGIEAKEILHSIIKQINPCCMIVIDALASRSLNRLGCTIQINDSGISPGSGIGNKRPLISKDNLGIPVIGIGVPTVVDADTLVADLLSLNENKFFNQQTLKQKTSPRGETMIVTPKEIDILISRAALLIGMAINCSLHPDFSPDDLYSYILIL